MKERLISAVIALLITVPLILLGGRYFNLLVLVLGILGLKELLDRKNNIPNMIKYVSYFLFVALLFYGYTFTGRVYIMNFSLVIITFFIMFMSLIFYNNNKKYTVNDVFYLIASIIFLSAGFNLFMVVRSRGLMLTIYLLLVTTMTDTFAYVVGSKIGKKKLIPNISPNKTVEGSLAGLILGTVIASLFYLLCVSSTNFGVTILMTICLSIIGQSGDLIFSSFKRHFGIKDFSNLMPGHGGVLDRLDSIIFVLFGYILFAVII